MTAKWTELLTTPEAQALTVMPVSETPITVSTVPEIRPQPEIREPTPDFELECAFVTSGCSKATRWVIEETLRERGQTATPELIWYWQQKLQNRERL
jgi:hypothetical protein